MATTPPARGSLDFGSRLPARGGASRIRRFNGLTRRTSDWDGLRKDSQLWFDSADCVVHFSAYRASQRGPSLKIPYDAVKALDCEYLSDHCLRTRSKLSPIPSEDGHSDSGYGSELERTEYELYIPAPSDLSRDEAFDYHLVTRNLLAHAVRRPLVGERLSAALADVWQRIQDWRVRGGSLERFTEYCKSQGYLTLADDPEHALAFLRFAEGARLRDLWIGAFVHCVGMHQILDLSPEWPGLSNTTVALITRASLEMDLHIGRIVRALGGFLEGELGAENLGLSRQARDHLDRFRSFLHAFYVDKLGYFPPPDNAAWNKGVWGRIHADFQCLHDYLVDGESTRDLNGNRGMTGGVCVVQNVSAFDARHGYDPLPHPLPLLPAVSLKPRRGVSSQRGLRSLTLGMSASAPDLRDTPRQILERASNARNPEVMACTLVQQYRRFERERLEEKLDPGEARKVRWILIYAVLQMLNSIMSAPREVPDTKTPSYPLCSLTTGCPPWKDTAPILHARQEPVADAREPTSKSLVPDAMDALEGRTSRISIHPDCEADSAEQFFASNGPSRRSSQVDMTMAPPPLRVNTQLSRRGSLRESMHSSVTSLHKSVMNGLNRRGSSRRNSLVPEPKKMPSFCEIVVEGYGNGLDLEPTLTGSYPSSADPGRPSPAPSDRPTANDFALFDFGLASPNPEPMLEDPALAESTHAARLYVDHPDLVDTTTSPRDSHASEDFALYRISSRGSFADPGTPATEVDSGDEGCGAEGEEEEEDDDDDDDDGLVLLPTRSPVPGKLHLHSYVPSKPPVPAPDGPGPAPVSAGCYLPTGLTMAPPTSRFALLQRQHAVHHQPQHRHRRQQPSTSSVRTVASSVYPDEPVQAADIVEENVAVGEKEMGRGRGLLRGAL